MLSLALLYVTRLPQSPYQNNERIRDWAKAGLRFWMQIQHTNGSFDEYYPWEHGYIPTSFSLFSATETCRLLGIEDSEIQDACLKAGRYLADHHEDEALNQEAASIPGLFNLYLLTGEGWACKAARAKFERIAKRQSPDGYFAEYGGADIGYLSTTLDFLLEYRRLSGDQDVDSVADRIVDFSSYFIHQDGSVGGIYGSRNTEYFLLSPLCLMAKNSTKAAAILERLRLGPRGVRAYYRSFDDRYLCHNMLHSLLRAVKYAPSEVSQDFILPCDAEHEQYFEDAGLLSINRKGSHLLCGLGKGGCLRLFNKGGEVFSDFGYRIIDRRSLVSATCWQRSDSLRGSVPGSYRIETDFTVVKSHVATPLKHMVLRVLAKLIGSRLIPFLKKRLIFVERCGPGRLARQIDILDDGFRVTDQLDLTADVKKLYRADKFSLRHVASSKYFSLNELKQCEDIDWNGSDSVRFERFVKWEYSGESDSFDVMDSNIS
ncbi:MAG: hypothetical protein VX294_02680 [Candidatus Latescibacterota bacterium]|nr:hypothetical protein [Candidatus Latescibacterota bacterium]